MWKSVLMHDLLLRAHLPPGKSRYPRTLCARVSAAGSFFFYCQAIKIWMDAERPTAWKLRGGRGTQQLRGRNGVYDIIAEEHDLSVAHALKWEGCWDAPVSSLEEAYKTPYKLWRCHFSTAWFSTNTRAMNAKQTVWRQRERELVLIAVSLVNSLMNHHLN